MNTRRYMPAGRAQWYADHSGKHASCRAYLTIGSWPLGPYLFTAMHGL